MKKLITIILAIAIATTLSITAFAVPNNFVESIEKSDDIIIEDFEGDEIEIIIFNDRDKLPDELRESFEEGFKKITEVTDLGELSEKLKDIAEKNGIPVEDLAIGDFFFVTDKDGDGKVDENPSVVVKVDGLDKFVTLMEYVNGEWRVVDAKVVNDGKSLSFKVNNLGAYAVVLDAPADKKAPQTGESSPVALVVGAVLFGAAAAVCFKKVK